MTDTPAIVWGYWKARNMPAFAAVVGAPAGDVVALEQDAAVRDLVLGAAEQRGGEGRLARAVGPHQRVDLARADREVDAAEDLAGAGHHRPDVQVLHLEQGRRHPASVFPLRP